MLIPAIQKALKKACLDPLLLEVMDYAVFPAGKLFRPRLVEALGLDLSGTPTPDHLHLAAGIEIHHAYTLVHDDLPAMDNDFFRRGKPSTHAKFGEWQAILGGDALLIASFQEMANISHENFREIHKLMTWATGAKGLIQGQFQDLLANGKLSAKEVVKVHELKTGRLIQLATLGTYLLTKNPNLRGKIEFLRLGREIGVSFQLLDDLSELSVREISPHEKLINPFINSLDGASLELKNSCARLMKITEKHQLTNTEKMLTDYFRVNQKNLLENFSILEENIGQDLGAIKSWLTNFV